MLIQQTSGTLDEQTVSLIHQLQSPSLPLEPLVCRDSEHALPPQLALQQSPAESFRTIVKFMCDSSGNGSGAVASLPSSLFQRRGIIWNKAL